MRIIKCDRCKKIKQIIYGPDQFPAMLIPEMDKCRCKDKYDNPEEVL